MNETAAKLLFHQDVIRIDARLLSLRNWIVYQREFPIFEVGFRTPARAEMRLRMIAADWNDNPPSIEIRDKDGRFLDGQAVQRLANNVFNASAHPTTGRPFVCMAGSLEYHTHSSHLNDSWSNYKRRDSHTLGGIMTQLWNAWQKCKI